MYLFIGCVDQLVYDSACNIHTSSAETSKDDNRLSQIVNVAMAAT